MFFKVFFTINILLSRLKGHSSGVSSCMQQKKLDYKNSNSLCLFPASYRKWLLKVEKSEEKSRIVFPTCLRLLLNGIGSMKPEAHHKDVWEDSIKSISFLEGEFRQPKILWRVIIQDCLL